MSGGEEGEDDLVHEDEVGSNEVRTDRCGRGPGLWGVSRLVIAIPLLTTVGLKVPTRWLKC